MKYALENLELIINTALSPAGINATIEKPALLLVLIERVTIEKDIVIKSIKDDVFVITDPSQIKLLIRKYQYALLTLANTTSAIVTESQFNEKFTDEVKQEAIKACSHTQDCIDQLILFLKENYPNYFDLEKEITENHKLEISTNFKIGSKILVKHFKNIDIPVLLLHIMMEPFQIFNKQSGERITYKQIIYLKMLEKSYQEFADKWQLVDDQFVVLNFLLYLNFNDYYFITYYIKAIKKDVSASETCIEQIARLAWWLKIISQIQPKQGVAYKPANVYAKDQLLCWVQDEIQFLEKKNQLSAVATYSSPVITDYIKIATSLSVKQLALFIRLLVDSGIIKPENHRDILTKVSSVIKTEKVENISSQSLQAKYYTIEGPTKEIMKEYLYKMSEHLRGY